jgi:hypothetical protein
MFALVMWNKIPIYVFGVVIKANIVTGKMVVLLS